MHLRAAMPPLRAVRGMESRIARKVAALTGIAGGRDVSDDAGRGESWFSDHERLTLTELRLGGPLGTEEAPGVFVRHNGTIDTGTGAAPLPNATMGKYGPDTKAALVLTGADHILEQAVAPAVRAALEDVRAQVRDGLLLTAVAQALLQEVFEAQPVLLLHGIQAGRVQRALGLSTVVDDRRPTASLARVEYGSPGRDGPPFTPMRLRIVHDVWDGLVAADRPAGDEPGGTLPFRSDAGYEQDHTFAIGDDPDRRADRTSWLCDLSERLLVGGPGGVPGVVRISHVGGVSHAIVVQPRERRIEAMLAQVAPRTTAGAGPDRTDGGRPVVLPTLDVSRWARAGLLDRRAVLLAHYYAVRAAGWLSGMRAVNRPRDRAAAAQRYTELADAAGVLLDADDPLLLQLDAHCRAYALRHRACRGVLDHDQYRQVVRDLDRLVAATDAGRCSPATLLELMHLVLVALGTYRYATSWYVARRGGGAIGGDELRRLWPIALRLRDELVGDGPAGTDLDHSYAGHLVSDPTRPDDLLEGIRLLVDSVIPARRDARVGRGCGLRLSLQTLLHALASALDHGLGSADQRAGWIDRAHAVADELSTDERLRAALAGEDPGPDNTIVILAYRIAAARVSATTTSGPAADPARIERTRTAVSQAAAYTAGGPPGLIDNLRVRQVDELVRRWEAWDGPARPGP